MAKLEGSYAHLATKADIAEVKTLIVQAEGSLDTKITQVAGSLDTKITQAEGSFDTKITQAAGNLDTKITQVAGSLDTKVEAVRVDTTRLILRVTGAVIASQLTMAGLLFTAIKLWG